MSDKTAIGVLDTELFSWVHLYDTMQKMKEGAKQNSHIRTKLMESEHDTRLPKPMKDEITHDWQAVYQESNRHMSGIFRIMKALQTKVREAYQHFPSES